MENQKQLLEGFRIINSKEIDVICSLLEFMQDLHAHIEPDIYKSYDIAQFSNLIKSILAQQQYSCFVAYVKELPVGIFIVNIQNYPETPLSKPRTVLYGFMIAVRTEYQKLGIAKSLLDRACEFAKENDITEIEVNVCSKNSSAMNFFNKSGFVSRVEFLYKYV